MGIRRGVLVASITGMLAVAVAFAPSITGATPPTSSTTTAPTASITLEKTVMVDTGVDQCGSEEFVSVGVGTTVRYCFHVNNTSDATFTVHDLVDDQLGTILSGSALVLAPFSAMFLTQTATISATVTNTATWTASDPVLGVEASATDSVTVQVESPEIILEKTVMVDTGVDQCGTDETLTVDAGTTVRYCFHVQNFSQTTFTVHDLVDDQLGTILSGSPLVLAPFSAEVLTQTATINATVTNTATWTASNPSPGSEASATDSVTVTVDPLTTTIPETTTTDPGTTTTTLVSGGGGGTTTTTTAVPSVTTTSPGQTLPATGASPSRSLWFSVALVSVGLASLMLARIRRTTIRPEVETRA